MRVVDAVKEADLLQENTWLPKKKQHGKDFLTVHTNQSQALNIRSYVYSYISWVLAVGGVQLPTESRAHNLASR